MDQSCSAISSFVRPGDDDFGPLARFALNPQVASDLRGAFGHDADSQMTRRDDLWVETTPIILDMKLNPIWLFEQRNLDLGCLSVFNPIVQGFLGNAIKS